jgi:putative transposase
VLVREHGLSIGRACRVARLSRTAWYRRPRSCMERDRAVIEVLNEVVARRPRWGFWKLYDRLRPDGCGINHKRLHRVCCAMKLNLPRRTKRRLPTRIRQPLAAPSGLNQIWGAGLHGGCSLRRASVPDTQSNPSLTGNPIAFAH